ncbi:MAG: Lrp/AsnC ligand binding domain-containing protein [Hyphomicrobiales bacterium]
MDTKFKLDTLDKRILEHLMKDARKAYLEIARDCGVSGAAIHQRLQKMTEAGVITGSELRLSPKDVGYTTCAFIGLQVNLSTSRTHEEVYERIMRIDEIVECHHTSGKYSLFIKIYAKDNEHLKNIIIGKIQAINEITSTETFVSLQEGFSRHIPIK